MRSGPLAALILAAALAATAAACGSDGESGQAGASEPVPTGTAESPTTGGDGIDPLEGATTEPVTAPAEEEEIALLERVEAARHEGYDRVVFQFRNVLPGYRVEYVEPPFSEDGSGNPVEVEGSAFVAARLEPASGFDLSVPEGEKVYLGPKRISGADAGTPVVQEIVRTGDFEAVLSWVIGLSDPVDYRVTTLDGPPRLVLDFRNH